jgi:hypothetical protein
MLRVAKVPKAKFEEMVERAKRGPMAASMAAVLADSSPLRTRVANSVKPSRLRRSGV